MKRVLVLATWICVCVRVCVRLRAKERECVCAREKERECVCMFVCVCVLRGYCVLFICARKKDQLNESVVWMCKSEWEGVWLCVLVCACVYLEGIVWLCVCACVYLEGIERCADSTDAFTYTHQPSIPLLWPTPFRAKTHMHKTSVCPNNKKSDQAPTIPTHLHTHTHTHTQAFLRV